MLLLFSTLSIGVTIRNRSPPARRPCSRSVSRAPLPSSELLSSSFLLLHPFSVLVSHTLYNRCRLVGPPLATTFAACGFIAPVPLGTIPCAVLCQAFLFRLRVVLEPTWSLGFLLGVLRFCFGAFLVDSVFSFCLVRVVLAGLLFEVEYLGLEG